MFHLRFLVQKNNSLKCYYHEDLHEKHCIYDSSFSYYTHKRVILGGLVLFGEICSYEMIISMSTVCYCIIGLHIFDNFLA
nr:hypothetical protein Itr_chr08CG14270 [Ipomoea trifida]